MKIKIQKLKLKAESVYKNHKGFTFLLAIHIITIAIVFRIIPITYENNWFYFFTYLFENNSLPYIDYREGYPPLGFLIYMPIAYLANKNPVLFAYGMRIVNAVFLYLSLILTYLILYEVRGRRKAILGSIIFVVLPSMIVSRFSNDIIALFFTLLAIRFMISRRATLTGLTIGLAFMIKGFPALLIIPALRWFKELKTRYKLLFSTFLVVYFLSLPFLIADPFMYISTFIHHGTRGPWETIWALIDGWQSHGGFIHPDFDQFFYHYQLLNIYPLLPNDHAFYAWRYSFLSTFLLGCELAMILVSYLLIGECKDGKTLLRGAGLTIIGYILFFKGYSPQFTAFVLPFILVSLSGFWMVFLSVLLDIATELQSFAWNPDIWLTHDLHLPILTSAIIIRTIVFVATVILLSIHLSHFKR